MGERKKEITKMDWWSCQRNGNRKCFLTQHENIRMGMFQIIATGNPSLVLDGFYSYSKTYRIIKRSH